MKIAIVSDAIYPYNKGGKEKRIYEVSKRLAKHGHDIDVYTMKWWSGESDTKIENGVNLHSISKLYPLYSGKRRSIKQAIMFAIACFKLIKKDYDFIEADHMPHLILFPLKIVATYKRRKLIVVWNEVWGRDYWVSYMGNIGNVAAQIEKLSMITPDEIVSISKHTTSKLIRELKYHKKITTIPMGIDTKTIREIKPSNNKSDVIFAGRLLSNKNVDVLIKSINILKSKNPDIKCFIIGEGPEGNNLRKLVNELKLEDNIKFFNFVAREEDLYALIKSSKVFVLPSTREGFGIVVLEANACGIPVITTDGPDNAARNLIEEDVNGVVSPLDASSIANNISILLKRKINPEICIRAAAPFDWDNITLKMEAAYRA